MVIPSFFNFSPIKTEKDFLNQEKRQLGYIGKIPFTWKLNESLQSLEDAHGPTQLTPQKVEGVEELDQAMHKKRNIPSIAALQKARRNF